jgi:hypothetical protein
MGHKYPQGESKQLSQGIENKQLSENGNSERVQNRVHKSTFPDDLQAIIDAWPELPEHIKATIKVLVQTQNIV